MAPDILKAGVVTALLFCKHTFYPGKRREPWVVRCDPAKVECPIKWAQVALDALGESIDWLQKMVAHRIADPLILRLIGKWLKAGYMVEGVVLRTEEGSPQGGPISPILSNIYLHFVLDLWFEKKIKPTCQGEAYLTRFADDCAPRRREGGFMN